MITRHPVSELPRLPWIFPVTQWKSMGLPEISRVTWQLCRVIANISNAAITGCHLLSQPRLSVFKRYPDLQEQVKDPGVLWQKWAHPPFPWAHSSISGVKIRLILYTLTVISIQLLWLICEIAVWSVGWIFINTVPSMINLVTSHFSLVALQFLS